ncbi:MAG: hypothetical protein ABIQ16_27105 [Polyangiaceae bacterium]
MSNPKIQDIIQNFVAELTAALTEASHEALTIALGGSGGGGVGNGKPGKKTLGSKPAAMALPDGRKRRNADDVQAQLDAILAHLKKAKEPAGAEAIGASLGLSTTELARPIKLGLSCKALKKTGKLRGTKYRVA